MLELLTGAGLATAAGLNAYVPLLAIGLASRFTELVQLPPAWAWLENEWVLVVFAVLLVVELVADKVPAVDSVNDWIQTLVRPTAGGIVFGSGAASETASVTDPEAFVASGQWVPIAIGALLALAVHVGKALLRPVANAATLGIAAPVLSTVEDAGSVLMTAFAILAPVLVVLGLAGLATAFGLVLRRRRRARERRRAGRALAGGSGV
jgi:hypothetical protein